MKKMQKASPPPINAKTPSAIPDSSICRYASCFETVNNLLCDLLICNNNNGLGAKVLDHVVAHLDQVWPSLGSRVVNDGIRDGLADGVNDSLSKRFFGVWRRPNELCRAAGLADMTQ